MLNINKELYIEALENKKNMIIEFGAPWCVYCRRIGPAYKKVAEEYGDKLIVGYVNIDEEPELAAVNNIEAVPSFVFYKEGQAVDLLLAPDSKAKIEEFINSYL